MKYQMSSSSNKIMLVQRDHPEYDYKSVTVFQIKNIKKVEKAAIQQQHNNNTKPGHRDKTLLPRARVL